MNSLSGLDDGSCCLVPHIYPVRKMADIEHIQTRICPKGQADFVYNSEVEKEFLEGLSQLLQEIFNNDIPFVPTSESTRCQSCAYYQLCKG